MGILTTHCNSILRTSSGTLNSNSKKELFNDGLSNYNNQGELLFRSETKDALILLFARMREDLRRSFRALPGKLPG